MHKKLFFILIVVVSIAALGACGKENSSPNERNVASPFPLPTESPSTSTTPPHPESTPSDTQQCDWNPDHWVFQSRKYGNVIISPKCALSDLGRAAAWYIAVHEMGYPPFDAAQALGYKEIPWAISRNNMVPYTFGLPEAARVAPTILDFGINAQEWALSDKTGTLGGIVLSPRSCVFIKQWDWRDKYGFPFDVECMVNMYFSSPLMVYQYHHEVGQEPMAQPLLLSLAFVYTPTIGHWMFAGLLNDPPGTEWPLELVNDTPEQDARAWGVPVWDLKWVQETWALKPKPLPDGWDSSTKGIKEVMTKAWEETQKWIQEHATFEVKKSP